MFAVSASSENGDGSDVFWTSVMTCASTGGPSLHSDRSAMSGRSRHSAAAVAGLNRLNGGAQFGDVVDRLRHQLRVARRSAITCPRSPARMPAKSVHRLLLGPRKPVAGAHAEGVVDRDHQILLAGIRFSGWDSDVRIGEQQREQQNDREAQREQSAGTSAGGA